MDASQWKEAHMYRRALIGARDKGRGARSRWHRISLLSLLAMLFAGTLAAQAPLPMESITLDEAVHRALTNNPTIAQVSQGVLRAEALLQQARSATRPTASAAFSNITADAERGFEGVVTQPRNQSGFSASVSMPILAMSRWAATTQARDQIEIANLSTAEVRTDIAVATAQAYLAIIAQKRLVEVSLRARETSLAHLDYAQRRLAAGAGTRLNELRAGQEVATNEARLENAQLGVRRAQEALGVLVVADGPVDAAGEPVFDVNSQLAPSGTEAAWMAARPDIRLFAAAERAADRVWRDSFKDFFPTGAVSFEPLALAPAGAFNSARSWRFVVSFSQPIFDGGERRGLRRAREAAFNVSSLALQGLQIQARSEVRLAQETVRSSERALASLRSAAEQANGVLSIVNIAFEAGATTNLEVIDAQRQARDADSSAAVAEDVVRRARLDLLTALGRFPQ
jgi:outer membrane protein